MIWLVIEVITLAFIFLITRDRLKLKTLSGIKFFLIQALSSIFLLFRFLVINYFCLRFNWFWLIELVLIFKIGTPPFHSWVVSMAPDLTWINFFYFSSVIKIIPLNILRINYRSLMAIVVIFGRLVSTYGGIFQYKLKLVLIYSSIFIYNWIFVMIMSHRKNWLNFFVLYVITLLVLVKFLVRTIKNEWDTNFNLISIRIKFYLFLILLIIGGFPPFPIFFFKLSILINMLNLKILYLGVFIIAMSGGNIYIYIKFRRNFLMLSNYQNFINQSDRKNILLITFLTLTQYFLILWSSFKI